MKYQEKIKFANDIVADMKNGVKMEQLRASLKEKNLFESDIDQVITSAKNIMEDELGEKLITYLKNGTLEENKHEFAQVDSEVMDILLYRAKNRIKSDVNTEVKKLADQGLNDEEIINQLSSDIVTKSEISTMISNFRYYVEKPKGPEKTKYIMIGSGSLILGLIVMIYSFMNDGGGRFGMAIIAFGVYNLFNAFMAKGEHDAYKS